MVAKLLHCIQKLIKLRLDVQEQVAEIKVWIFGLSKPNTLKDIQIVVFMCLLKFRDKVMMIPRLLM